MHIFSFKPYQVLGIPVTTLYTQRTPDVSTFLASTNVKSMISKDFDLLLDSEDDMERRR